MTEQGRLRGALAHQAGRMAEAQVARWYAGRGLTVHATRWRGQGGEIDLILADGAGFVLCRGEAGARSGRGRAPAAPGADGAAASRRRRVPGRAARGLDTPVRFDVALVDGQGRVEVIENALGG
jgi:putative endonuclease